VRPSTLPIEERIERAAQHVVRAQLFFEIWFYFESAGNIPVRLNALNQFANFFYFDSHAHLIAFIVYIYGLFEDRKDSINLNRLTRELRNINQVSKVHLIDLDYLFNQAAPIVKKVKYLRHNAIAHRTASKSYNDVFRLADTTYDELRELTEIALKIVNHLLRAVYRKEEHFHRLPLTDLDALVGALARS
jgi:hypothetical protein